MSDLICCFAQFSYMRKDDLRFPSTELFYDNRICTESGVLSLILIVFCKPVSEQDNFKPTIIFRQHF
jgi:hypothetical protein